jgi:hypothetical protein
MDSDFLDADALEQQLTADQMLELGRALASRIVASLQAGI